jgi:hypothetical protein
MAAPPAAQADPTAELRILLQEALEKCPIVTTATLAGLRSYLFEAYASQRVGRDEDIDIGREQAALAREASVARVRRGDLRAIPAARPAHYTAITATDLLEHHSKPEVLQTLDDVAAVPVPGDIFVGSAPNEVRPLGGHIRNGDFTHKTPFATRSIRQLPATACFDSVLTRCSPPVADDVTSDARMMVWQVVSACYQIVLATKTGMLHGHIVIQNLTFAPQGRGDREACRELTMCGITKTVDTVTKRAVTRVSLIKYAQMHRVPDHGVIVRADGITLGNLWQAIQGPTPPGNQEFDRRHACVFNSEIYNHRELAERFQSVTLEIVRGRNRPLGKLVIGAALDDPFLDTVAMRSKRGFSLPMESQLTSPLVRLVAAASAPVWSLVARATRAWQTSPHPRRRWTEIAALTRSNTSRKTWAGNQV